MDLSVLKFEIIDNVAVIKMNNPPMNALTPSFLDDFGKKMLLTVGGGLIGFLVFIHILGFYGAIFVFMIYYMKFLGRHSWVLTLIISTALPVICFFFFDIAMRIVLPKGYLEPLFIPLYDIFL